MPIEHLERLARPPRRVPLPVRCHQLFGGPANLGAWCLLLFCTPFFWLFVMDCEVLTWIKFARPLSTTTGAVTNITRTGSSENKIPVMEIHYSYALDGEECTGHSYETGTRLQPGSPVTVEYAVGSPHVSRIQGLRSRSFGWGAIFVLLFPAIALTMLGFCLFRGFRAIRLLGNGRAGGATLKSTASGSSTKRYGFEFSAEGRTYDVPSSFLAKKFSDSRVESVLYDVDDPRCAMLVDDLPVPVRIDNSGGIHPISSRRALLAMLLPIAVTTINVLCAMNWRY